MADVICLLIVAIGAIAKDELLKFSANMFIAIYFISALLKGLN